MFPMTGLPIHIEEYLKDTGFTATEILVLRRLLEGTALTLREMASKTGKSTGVLDQSCKKLLRKKIISKEVINGTPKYVLASIEAVREWVRQDMGRKKDQLTRRHDDFESYIESIIVEKDRPDMEYFEGFDGIQRAYLKLLDLAEGELLHYIPIQYKEEEDPLRDFRVDFFRKRRKKEVFSRVITSNSSLGRRFQSRDVFEYRKTVLIPEEKYPFLFEQVIAGNVFACINHQEQKAYFINFPHLVQSERIIFESLWDEYKGGSNDEQNTEDIVPLKTRTASGLREFFLSKSLMLSITSCMVIALCITYGLYFYTLNIVKEEIALRLMSVAITASSQINAKDLENLQFVRDMKTSEYQRVFNLLNEIKNGNSQIKYAYIFRPTKDKTLYQFVADAESNYYLPNIGDTNLEEIVPPGTYYDVSNFDSYMKTDAFKYPIANKDFSTDKWGTFISASAPIFDQYGTGIAMLGLDMDISDVVESTRKKFRPIIFFLCIFIISFFIRIGSLFKFFRKLK